MKVLFVTNQLQIGGIEKNLVRLTAVLSERGHVVVVASGGGSLVGDLGEAGGFHVDCPLGLSPRSLMTAAIDLRKVIRDERPEVIHVFSASAALAIWFARRFPGPFPPLISSIMGLTTDPDEPRWRVMARTYATSVGVDRLIVMAPAIDSVVRGLRIQTDRIVHQNVVGIDVDALTTSSQSRRAARDELGVRDGESVVVTVGGLLPSKSHHLFIEAAAVMERANTHFFIIGRGPLHGGLQARIDHLGLTSSVHLLGEKNDATDLMVGADVYVRPGVVEGFVGITVLEAQALGIPVVSFETEDVKLSIQHRRTGWLVPSHHPADLARAITHLLDDPLLARSVAQGGAEHVRKHFDLRPVVDGLERLYGEVAARAGTASGPRARR